MRDMAYVYRDLVKARKKLEDVSDAEFLSAQQHYEQVEVEWLEIGEKLGLTHKEED